MPLPPPHGQPMPGDRLGPYRIVRQLGSGGMGTVYDAQDTALGRHVALKVIASGLAGDPEFRARFVREAQAQASLDSPHVVQVFAHGDVAGRLYIASQLIPDGDLGQMLRRHGPLPPALAADLVAQVADGLAEAHRVGLVHRDIKPANVLLRKRGTHTVAYLTDFGIARQVDAGLSNAASLVAGTPGYLAPELHRGAAAGPASDVYSLGCLLWTTLTGRAPYEGATSHQVAEGHARGPIPQLPGATAFEREVNRILRSALAKDPGERHPSAAALRDDLRPLARTTTTTHARRTPPVAAAVPGVLALVVVVALAVGLVVGLVGRGGEDAAAGGDGSDRSAREERAVANVARALEEDGDLDAEGARCTARQLVDRHGVEGLQGRGLIDEDLLLVGDEDGRVDPAVLADLFTTTFSCLWSASP